MSFIDSENVDDCDNYVIDIFNYKKDYDGALYHD